MSLGHITKSLDQRASSGKGIVSSREQSRRIALLSLSWFRRFPSLLHLSLSQSQMVKTGIRISFAIARGLHSRNKYPLYILFEQVLSLQLRMLADALPEIAMPSPGQSTRGRLVKTDQTAIRRYSRVRCNSSPRCIWHEGSFAGTSSGGPLDSGSSISTASL